MNGKPARLRLVPALLLLAACDSRTPHPVTTSWPVGAKPVVTISTASSPAGQELTGVLSARRLADGRIVVANSGTSALLVFDTAGALIQALGRKGEGPGEFTGSLHLFRSAGDSLAVYDGGNLRWTFYDAALQVGRTALAAEAGIPRPTWLHNGAMVTNASLDDSTNWAVGVIDGLRALDPGFNALIEARLDDTGALWVRDERRWIVHGPDRATPGEVVLPDGVRVLQAGADFVLGLTRDSVDQDVLQVFSLERAGPAAPAAASATSAGPAPGVDSAMIAAISSQLLMKQEMYYADHAAYASHADSLRGVFGDDVKAFILWGDARHWALVTVRKATGATCGVAVGWPAPAGWFDGTAFCGRE